VSQTSILATPGEFTKRANLTALLAALGASPIIGASSGTYAFGGSSPVESAVGGAAGGAAGGLAGAGLGAAAGLLLQLISKRQFNPSMLTSAATLAGLLGALKGGQLGATASHRVTGVSEEALLSAILQEIQGQNPRRAPAGPDLLR